MTKVQVDSNGKVITLGGKALVASEGGSATLITKNITQNGTYNASSDNADGYSSVSVNVAGTTPTGTLSITANGTYDVTNYASANVSVAQQPRYLKATINGSNSEPSEDQELDMQYVEYWLSDKEITAVLMLENFNIEAMLRLMPAGTPFFQTTNNNLKDGGFSYYLSCHIQNDISLSYPTCGEFPGHLPSGIVPIYKAYVEGSNYTQTYDFVSMGNMPYIYSKQNITIFTEEISADGYLSAPIYLRTTEDIVFLPVY